jgi:hypothetical protein
MSVLSDRLLALQILPYPNHRKPTLHTAEYARSHLSFRSGKIRRTEDLLVIGFQFEGQVNAA